jgi:hypothetical protein
MSIGQMGREFLDSRGKGLSNRIVTKDSPQCSSLRDGWFENGHSLRGKTPFCADQI